MAGAPFPPIETPRLRLRAFTRGDVEAVYSYRRRDDVAQYLLDDALTHAMCADLVQLRVNQTSLQETGDRLVLAIERKSDGAMLGEVLLILRDVVSGQAEVGYVIHPDYQGLGYATEAARALMDWGFDTIGLHRIYARCHPDNVASWTVMERLGMRREAHFREHIRVKGRWDEELVYAVLRREWKHVPQGQAR